MYHGVRPHRCGTCYCGVLLNLNTPMKPTDEDIEKAADFITGIPKLVTVEPRIAPNLQKK